MRLSLLIIPAIFYMTVVFSGSRHVNNNASIGNVIIDNQYMGKLDNVIQGSGIQLSIERKVKFFASVNVGGAFDINYRHGPASLTISGDDNIIQHVLSTVNNKVLTLKIDKSYRSRSPIVINIFSPNIKEMTIDGSSTVKLENIKTNQLVLKLTGSVDLMVTGMATVFDLQLQNTGNVKARQLDSDKVTVNLHGTGDIELTAHEELKANITGVGDILYFGSPAKVSKQILGLGEIEAGE